jgi:hypothetical protein
MRHISLSLLTSPFIMQSGKQKHAETHCTMCNASHVDSDNKTVHPSIKHAVQTI